MYVDSSSVYWKLDSSVTHLYLNVKTLNKYTIFMSFAGDIKQEPGLYREGPTYQRRGSLQLWQFLVALLDDPANSHFIAWTGRGMEFKLIEPEEVCTSTYFAVFLSISVFFAHRP